MLQLQFHVHPPHIPLPSHQEESWVDAFSSTFALFPPQVPLAAWSSWRKPDKAGGSCTCLFKKRKVVLSFSAKQEEKPEWLTPKDLTPHIHCEPGDFLLA